MCSFHSDDSSLAIPVILGKCHPSLCPGTPCLAVRSLRPTCLWQLVGSL